MSVVGFDIGNSNCVISAVRGSGVEVLCNSYSYRLTPSLVSLGEKTRFLGESARSQLVSNFNNSVSQVKRLIGRKYDDPDVQKLLSVAGYKHCANPNDGKILIKLKFQGEVIKLSPEQILAMLISELKLTAEHELKKPVVDVVCSIPSWFNNDQRGALITSIKIAGLNCSRILNDTTAAALSLGFYKNDLPEEGRVILFINFGHGDLQVSAVHLFSGELKVIFHTFLPNVGGRDLDHLIYDRLAAEFKQKHNIDVNKYPKSRTRLYIEAEKVKKLFSTNAQPIPVNVECLAEDLDLRATMTQAEFLDLAAPYFENISIFFDRIIEFMTENQINLHCLEIFGGSCRIPAFKHLLTKFGVDVRTSLNFDEAVSRGCAIMSAMLSPTSRTRPYAVRDCTAYAIDLTWISNNEPIVTNVFAESSEYNVGKVVSFVRNEPFEVNAVYSNNGNNLENRLFVGNEITSISVNDFSFDEPKTIKLRVNLDGNGMLISPGAYYETIETEQLNNNISPTESGSTPAQPTITTKKMKHPLPVKLFNTLSKKEFDRMAEVEINMFNVDRVERERHDAKNAVEEAVYYYREKLSDAFSPYVEEAEVEKLSCFLTTVEDWLYGEGDYCQKSIYVTKLVDIRTAFQHIIQRKNAHEEMPKALDYFKSKMAEFKKHIEKFLAKDPEFDHLDGEDVKKVADMLHLKEQWLVNVLNANPIEKYKEIVTGPSLIIAAAVEFERFATPIFSKPKPTPPPSAASSTTTTEAQQVPTNSSSGEDATTTTTTTEGSTNITNDIADSEEDKNMKVDE